MQPVNMVMGVLTVNRPSFVLGSSDKNFELNRQCGELSKQRFEICKTCDKATEAGHKCSLHKSCCFGAWRSRPESKCYLGKW